MLWDLLGISCLRCKYSSRESCNDVVFLLSPLKQALPLSCFFCLRPLFIILPTKVCLNWLVAIQYGEPRQVDGYVQRYIEYNSLTRPCLMLASVLIPKSGPINRARIKDSHGIKLQAGAFLKRGLSSSSSGTRATHTSCAKMYHLDTPCLWCWGYATNWQKIRQWDLANQSPGQRVSILFSQTDILLTQFGENTTIATIRTEAGVTWGTETHYHQHPSVN